MVVFHIVLSPSFEDIFIASCVLNFIYIVGGDARCAAITQSGLDDYY